MHRRQFVAFSGAAFGTLLFPTRAPAADVSPIGIAEFGRGDQRYVIRIYPAGRANSFLLHIRLGRRGVTQRLQVSGDPQGMMRGLVTDGRAQVRLDGRDVTLSAPNAERGVFEIDGVGQVNVVTQPATTPNSQPVSVAIVSLLLAAAAWGYAVGSGGSTTTASSSGGSSTTTTEEAEEEEEGDGIIASPECDGPPIRLC